MQIPFVPAAALTRRAKQMMTTAILLLFAGSGPTLAADGVAANDAELIRALPEKALTFDDVRPTLERRCIVCHGCYDAPCQLKLSSMEGIKRGANKKKVYDKGRFTWQQPSRLFIDAKTVGEWRSMGFSKVVGADSSNSPEENLSNSLLYRMLNLKRQHPMPTSGALPDDLDVSLDREQVCSNSKEFSQFARKHPLWGMPFALPNLSDKDHTLLVQWLAQGGRPSPAQIAFSERTQNAVEKWEGFFNRKGNKAQLVSRYIYEHLVLAHLHFEGAPKREFFRLVRSRTPPGQPINEIPTVRPYDDPEGDFYYRLRHYPASIVDKSHIVYELSDARMNRYEELFFDSEPYEVAELPGYTAGESSNFVVRFWTKILKLIGLIKPATPFETFAAIPPKLRYQFLLDEARFFINGFIKGPVCRGIGALSSIEDQFWVFFLKPEDPVGGKRHDLDPAFLETNDQLLHLPTELADTNRLLTAWIKYWPLEQKYMQAKFHYYAPQLPINIHNALKEFVWDGVNGDGTVNRNAALTVFRNLDSASVQYGLLGDEPETAWIIDYSVFERLHYLLVAGYNTFGTIGHQASARLYMDFLRTEGEDTFLFFLPTQKRKELYASWHGVVRMTTREQNEKTSQWLDVESAKGYATTDEQHELFALLRDHIAAKSSDAKDLNRCDSDDCFASVADRAMQRLANLTGKSSEFMPLQYFPALSYLRIGGDSGAAYTVVYNKSYKQYERESFIKEVIRRDAIDMSGDTLTVVKGLIGAYPNFFFDIRAEEAEAFVDACEGIRSAADFDRLVERFGVRRTNPEFWRIADWFQELHARAQPVEGGILDLSRYRDRILE